MACLTGTRWQDPCSSRDVQPRAGIKSKFRLTISVVGTMTRKTRTRQNRPNVTVEMNGLRRRVVGIRGGNAGCDTENKTQSNAHFHVVRLSQLVPVDHIEKRVPFSGQTRSHVCADCRTARRLNTGVLLLLTTHDADCWNTSASRWFESPNFLRWMPYWSSSDR